jgi:hypothetical protein
MKRYIAALVILVVAIAASGAFATSTQQKATLDEGRRLAGPFCIGKRFLKPVQRGQQTTTPALQLAILRAGVVRSVGASEKCRPWENRKPGVAVLGPAGPKGDKGDAGVPGSQGQRGEAGAAGAQGSQGPAGAVGPAGAKGDTGSAGAKGEDGSTGPAGPSGPKGDTGAAGAQGVKGDTGAKGDKGDTGATGSAGAVGAAGPIGPVGPAGPKGDTGPAGPAGPKGDKGATGDIGSLETVTGGTATGEKQFTVSCPAGKQAISGGFDIQGSVTASFRSNAAGNPTGTNSWTIKQSSGAALSGTVYVYCA